MVCSDKGFDGKFEDDNVRPQGTLTWRPRDNLTLFTAYREGFKSGGFDASHLPSRGSTIDTLRFESEEAAGVEFGAKSRSLDDSVQANVTVYFFPYENLQVQQLDTETTTFIIDNAAEATIDGFTYERRVRNTGWRASMSAVGRYSGAYSTASRVPGATGGDHVILDAAVRLFSPNERWTLSLIGRNLTDESIAIFGGERPLTGGGQGSPAGTPELQRADIYHRVQRARQIWLQASYRVFQ